MPLDRHLDARLPSPPLARWGVLALLCALLSGACPPGPGGAFPVGPVRVAPVPTGSSAALAGPRAVSWQADDHHWVGARADRSPNVVRLSWEYHLDLSRLVTGDDPQILVRREQVVPVRYPVEALAHVGQGHLLVAQRESPIRLSWSLWDVQSPQVTFSPTTSKLEDYRPRTPSITPLEDVDTSTLGAVRWLEWDRAGDGVHLRFEGQAAPLHGTWDAEGEWTWLPSLTTSSCPALADTRHNDSSAGDHPTLGVVVRLRHLEEGVPASDRAPVLYLVDSDRDGTLDVCGGTADFPTLAQAWRDSSLWTELDGLVP